MASNLLSFINDDTNEMSILAGLHVPQNGFLFEPVHFKKRASMQSFFGFVLRKFTCQKIAPVLFTL